MELLFNFCFSIKEKIILKKSLLDTSIICVSVSLVYQTCIVCFKKLRIFWSSVKLSGSSYEAHCEKLFDNRSMSTLDFCILFCNFLWSFVVDLCNHMSLILSTSMISSQVCFSISFYFDAILFIQSVFTLNIFSLLQILLQNVLTSSIGTSTIFFLNFTLKNFFESAL